MDAMTYVINERPLTDDTLSLAPEGYTFRGRYVAILRFHTFATSQSDRLHVRRFRTMAACESFVAKRYGKPLSDLLDASDD